ncbi:alpha-1,2-mannosyltransferase MNN2 Ecym_5314 [Eremothecium cymbalariae DBVPG|uniref:Alpha-1,2-mannosyltransferase MNN2 n=1 Tax=Eremothecium cymbalariae (strain CBS 270.75 / DBVPG 7215 / KCTC 17166 / NRRL Y-17582) TaxID=931890 RepID=I6NDD3_ERECY|nr:hypothetical protein Ecym_5314 [Eremothecium cymbalariae DBVPG\
MLTRRFSKTLRLTVLTLIVCSLFLISNRTITGELSQSIHAYLEDWIVLNGGDGKDRQILQEVIDAINGEDETHRESASRSDNAEKSIPDKLLSHSTPTAEEESRQAKLRGFYEKVFNMLSKHAPSGSSSKIRGENCQLTKDIGGRLEDQKWWYKLSYEHLSKCLQVSRKDRKMLKKKHSDYVADLASLVLPLDSYTGNGIVTVGGGKFSVLAFLMITTLRNVGTTLPVEVLIPPNEESEHEFCNNVLPEFNAKCIYLSDVLPKSVLTSFEVKGYQLKSFAIIASSFQNLLLLDADNLPIKNLDDIFESKPYKSTGLVLWPDFWRRTTSPIYYEVAGIPINYNKRVRNSIDDVTPASVYTSNPYSLSTVPMHDLEGAIPDMSTESGQLMISKRTHLGTALLSLYYNVNGPTWYYPLFSQGASGEGDKETFIAAASFYQLPFYQVRTVTGVDGYHRSSGYRGVAMLQHDFRQDYERYTHSKEDTEAKYAAGSAAYESSYNVNDFYNTYFGTYNSQEPLDVMFVHSNLPKLEPLSLSTDLMEDGQHIRSYSNLKRLHGYDIELRSFQTFNEYLCDKRVKFKYYEKTLIDEESWTSMCDYIKGRLSFLERTHDEALNKN